MKSAILERALDEGFDIAGVAPARMGRREQDRLSDFVTSGSHGDMAWMADTLDRRRAPDALWSDARSVVVLGMSYGPTADPMDRLGDPGLANVSCYAWNRDYHDTVKKALKRLARWMAETYGCQVKVFVDTAPVLEKPLAALSTVGWQGKHTNLVSRDLGSWFFLGEVFTDLDLDPDPPEIDHCGSCSACQDVCPTNAFPTPYTLDARRCISYLTIEHKGPIPHEFREAIGNRVYGCDDCLAVCPWNKFAKAAAHPDLKARAEVRDARLAEVLVLDDAAFRALFRKSPVKRLGRDRFLRNCLIAAGNSGDTSLVSLVEALLGDASPTVRGAAVWALARLLDPARLSEAVAAAADDPDPGVQAEWRRVVLGRTDRA